MRISRLKFLCAIGAMFSISQALAADATLTFTGNIILPTCTPDASTVTQTIPLGTAKTTDFATVGSTLNATAFNLKLINCVTNTNVTMTVNGTMDTVASVLKNGGTATQVGVQLLKATKTGDVTGSPLQLNASVLQGTVDASGSMTIPLVAQLYRIGTMTTGTVSSSATVNFTYN
jgi:major type 1 subunit fimbrin (pilin)